MSGSRTTPWYAAASTQHQMPVPEWFYIYRWGASPCHLSGQRDMQGLYDSLGKAPATPGQFALKPHWREDYSAIVAAAREQWQVDSSAAPEASEGRLSPAPPRGFGCDTTFKRAAAYLSDIGHVEDWGCGTAYFKRFVPDGRYCGIDHDPLASYDKLAELATYRSTADGVLLRHVLEHDLRWQSILRNAIASFSRRMVVVVHTPFVRSTAPRARQGDPIPGDSSPEIHFCRGDLVREFLGMPFRLEENIRTDSAYGREHVFYLSKDGPA